MKQQEGFNPTFENGGFWEYYKDLERQFESFLEYVPYLKGNEETYSFKLLNIFLSIGGHIDSAFKEMARYSSFVDKESCKEILKRARKKQGIFISGVHAFDEIYGLTSKKVTFKCLPKRIPITPFGRDNQEWWKFYNESKHDISINLKKANLKNVRDALAGAFLLNVIHEPSADRLFAYGLLKEKYLPKGFGQLHDKFRGKEIQPTCCSPPGTKDQFVIETALFLYDYEKPTKSP